MLIRREDFGNLESLTKGSNKRVWYTCEGCGCGFLITYMSLNRKKYGHYCRQCALHSDQYKEECRKRNKEYQKDPEYLKKISEGVSKAKKGKTRSINTKKKPYYFKIQELLESENYQLVTTLDDYLKGNAYVKCICPRGHEFFTTYKKWTRENSRCLICKEEDKNNRIQNICDEKNFTLLDIYHEDGIKWIKFECENGHENFARSYNFLKGAGCMKCWENERRSKGEKEVFRFIKDELGIENVEHSNYSVMKDYEIDIFLPDYNLGIEYNGLYFHDEIHKDKKFHLMKTEKCENRNIQLIHIFEDEWVNESDKVKHRLKHILGKGERLYARNCTVKEIGYEQAKRFCEKYHIQNYNPCKIKLGLFYGNELVSVMTFSVPSISKGHKNTKNVWELNRFCSSKSVIGGASKLLSYFKNKYEWNKIITFADRRWSMGKLYTKIGFEFKGYTDINYWYIQKKPLVYFRYHRYKFRKSEIKHLGKGTEKEIMESLGYSRIWDCGNMKFEMSK